MRTHRPNGFELAVCGGDGVAFSRVRWEACPWIRSPAARRPAGSIAPLATAGSVRVHTSGGGRRRNSLKRYSLDRPTWHWVAFPRLTENECGLCIRGAKLVKSGTPLRTIRDDTIVTRPHSMMERYSLRTGLPPSSVDFRPVRDAPIVSILEGTNGYTVADYRGSWSPISYAPRTIATFPEASRAIRSVTSPNKIREPSVRCESPTQTVS